MNHYDELFLSLTDAERARLQLIAIKENFTITSFDSVMNELPNHYTPKKAYPLSEVHVRHSKTSAEMQESLLKFYETSQRRGIPYTPDVTQIEKRAEVILNIIMKSKFSVGNNPFGYPLREINNHEKARLLKLYEVSTDTESHGNKILKLFKGFWKL